jgi:DivIVA domain-containing protein
MQVTPRELRDMEIREGFRGYNRDEVDELLERAATTIEELQERIRKLSNRLTELEAAPPRPAQREAEETIHRTLLLAQRAADDAVAEAKAEAARLVEEARRQADALLADAETGARRVAEDERRRLEQEVLDLATRREALLADAEALERFTAEYRERVRRLLQEDLDRLAARATVSLPRPTLHDVDLPGGGGPTRSVPAAPGAPPPVAPGPVTAGAGAAAAEPAPGGRAAEPPPGRSAAEPPPGEHPAGQATGDTPTGELRLDGAAGAAAAGAAAGSGVGEQARPPVPAREEPPPAADAPALDDDAFFATLRDAVRNPEPLGPREAPGPQGGVAPDPDRTTGLFRRRR